MPKNILIIDDNDVQRLAAQRRLINAGYSVDDASDEDTAKKKAQNADLVIIDLELRPNDKDAGLRLLTDLRPSLPKIIWSDWEDPKIVRNAFDQPRNIARPRGYVFKKEGLDALVHRVRLEFAEADPFKVLLRRSGLLAALGLFIFGFYKLGGLWLDNQLNLDIVVGIMCNLLSAAAVLLIQRYSR